MKQKQLKQKNPFEFELLEHRVYRKKTLDIRTTIELVLGTYSMLSFSKRLLPPMAMSNARIYLSLEGHMAPLVPVWKGDLNFYTIYRILGRVANKYGLTLSIFSESGQEPVWTSMSPEQWLGWAPEEFKKLKYMLPIEVTHVYPHFKRMAEESRDQWIKDHGLHEGPTKKKAKVLHPTRRAKGKAAKPRRSSHV